jgi:hypothetical protein
MLILKLTYFELVLWYIGRHTSSTYEDRGRLTFFLVTNPVKQADCSVVLERDRYSGLAGRAPYERFSFMMIEFDEDAID